MKVIEDTAVELFIPNSVAAQVLEKVDKSEKLNEFGTKTNLVVYWGHREVMEVTRLFDSLHPMPLPQLPSPMFRDYNWPGIYTPFKHQMDTAAYLSLRPRAFCFNEAGTGKTSAAIWAADYLMKLGLIKRVLVICPLSIMFSAWQADIFKTTMHRTAAVAHGDKSKRAKIIASDYDFVIINFDGVGVVREEIKAAKFDLIVVDECFVAGTLIATPSGQVPIEQLSSKDKVLTSSGVARIKRLVRNTTKQLVEVKLNNEKHIRCTPDHPFFTDVGWVCARNLAGRRLISSAEVLCMRAGIPVREGTLSLGSKIEQTPWADLFQILCTEELSHTQPGCELLQQNSSRTTWEIDEAQVSSASGKIIGGTEATGTQTFCEKGERYGNDPIRTIDFRGFACGMGMELPNSVGQEAAWLSYKLQARFCVAAPEVGARGRRQQSHNACSEIPRQKERKQISGTWVESVSYIECTDEVAIFNLEIEGTPNYFVGDGCLVHNCNAYKTVSTVRWKTLAKLITPQTWLWMMTGTPASQSPVDAYGLAKMISPERVPKFATAWRDKVMIQASRFKWTPKSTAKDDVFSALQPAIRFSKAECLDLPGVTYQTRDIPLSAQVQKYYKALKTQLLIEAAGEQVSAVNAATAMSKLLQISGGAVYTDTKDIVEFDISPRLNALKEVLDETLHKVIVFVPFIHTIEIVTKFLDKEGVSNEVISGSVSARNRADIISRFQSNEDPRVLVIQPQSASHGVTLTAADTIVFWSPVLSVETYMQCIGRIDRVGQQNKMTVVHLQGSEAEKKVYQMLQGKIDSHLKLVDLYKQELNDE